MSDRAPLLHVQGAHLSALLTANLNCIALDFAARTAVGGTDLSYFIIKQLPVLLPETFLREGRAESTPLEFILPRVLELTYTAWDLDSFACDCGYDGPPFIWDEERRFLIRCELDALFFHMYLGNQEEWQEGGSDLSTYFPTPREAVEYIMETFPIVKRKDEKAYGHYRTKGTILEIYDELQRVMAENMAAAAVGRPPIAHYRTCLNPPPGPPAEGHGRFIPLSQWDQADWPAHIHQPRNMTGAQPEEVPWAEFAALIYPTSDTDKAICAAALAVVEQCGELSSMEHLDVLLLATHPDWCKAFLDEREHAAFEIACTSAPAALFVGQGQPIRWKECRDYLERLNALVVAHHSKGQPISAGATLITTKSGLLTGVDGVVTCALAGLERIRELRNDLSLISHVQNIILEAFAEQHREYELVP